MPLIKPFAFYKPIIQQVGPIGPSPVTDASALLLDATDINSYPGSGNTWTDLSGNGNNADVSLITSYWNAGGYFNWPGTDYTKVATVPHAASLNIFDGDFTIMFVGTITKTGTGYDDNVGPIAKINWDSNPGWGVLINRLTGGADIGKTNLRISGAWTVFSPSPIFLNVGDWFVVHMSRSGSTIKYYNTANQQIASGTNAGNGNNSSAITIGRGKNVATGNYKWDGKLAGIALYDKELSEAERQQNIDYFAEKLSFPAYDPDAYNFLAAAGISDGTQKSAVNTLVKDLKTAGIWSKMIAIYPFVGGTADKHKFNLKNPQNTDAAYRITWAGTVTHNSNGFQGNGTSGVGYTHIQIATDLSQNDVAAAMYIRTAAGGGTDYGAISGGAGMQLNSRYTDNLNYNKLMHGGAHYTQASTDGSGFWQQNRTSSSSYYVQQNTTRNTASVASSTPPSGEYIALAAIGTSETTAIGFSAKQYAFAAFGSGLSTTEMDDFNTAVQAFQTTLGRNV